MSLFQTVMISLAVESCEQKQLRMAVDSEKRTTLWNQNVKEAIQAKKLLLKFCCKTGHPLIYNRSNPCYKKVQLW